MIMNVTCKIELNYDSNEQANQVFDAVHMDDASFMDTKLHNHGIQTTITTSSVPSMLHTIDDFLCCVRVAEKIIEKRNEQSTNKKNRLH